MIVDCRRAAITNRNTATSLFFLGVTNPFAITATACVPSNTFTVVAVAKSDEDVVVFVDSLVLGVHHLRVFGGGRVGRILEVHVKGGGGGLEILRVIGVNNAPDGRL
jgi:hypothetical protein